MKMLSCFPSALAEEIALVQAPIYEVRLFAEGTCSLETAKGEIHTAFRMQGDLLYQTVQELCEHRLRISPEATGNGFITLRGGHRMGLCGRVTCDHGQLTLREVGSACVRVAHQVKGCGQDAALQVQSEKELRGVLIAGTPGSGKTTMLRDAVRILGDAGIATGLCDERSEIAACVQGVPQLDTGRRTHVLDGCSKVQGLRWLLRAMSPQLLAMDELYGEEECAAVLEAAACGVPLIATAHAADERQLCQRAGIKKLMQAGAFSQVLFLRERRIMAQKSARQVLEEGCCVQ